MGAIAAAMPIRAIGNEPDNAPMMVRAAPVAEIPTAIQRVAICLNSSLSVPILVGPEPERPKPLSVLSSAPRWPIILRITGKMMKLLHNGTWATIPAKGELDIERPIFIDAMPQGKKRESRWEQFLSGWGIS